MKKTISLILLIILVFSGCTKKIWNSTEIKEVSYDETIDAFMMNPADKTLIFVGEKYHYIFEPNEQFMYLYNNKNEDMFFDTNNGNYGIIINNQVVAYFDVYISIKNTKQEIIDWTLEHDGKYIDNNEKIQVRVSLKGKRYLSDPKVNQAVEKLSMKHNIKISDIVTEDEYSTASKIALTPLTVTGDVVTLATVGAFICIFPNTFRLKF